MRRDDAFEARVVEETRRFVERVVIGLGLCPFAATPWREGRVAVQVSVARDVEALLADLDTALRRLVETPADVLETTLLVHPHVLREFEAFNAFLDLAEALLVHRGYEGVLQLATFHPGYRFAGEPLDDPANATNRSPWPMLHLLREASVGAAIHGHGDAESIPPRNVALLRQMGAERVRALLASVQGDALRDDTPVDPAAPGDPAADD